MQRGIALAKMPPGELIYLNLPLHPGSKLDRQPPTPPQEVHKRAAENMGYPGIELTWKPASDDNWISYYEVLRNGKAIDKVAKGTYYFDHSAGADLAANYEIRTVDGAGNASADVAADGPAASPARVVDDAPGAGVRYTGPWQRQTGLQPAHAGTLSTSTEKGRPPSSRWRASGCSGLPSSAPTAAQAAVSIDGAPAETVDTYSADDIWGVCVFRKELAGPGPHTLRITVLGQRGPRAKDAAVSIDGFRIEP